jgi:hypothetical protein
MVNSFL